MHFVHSLFAKHLWCKQTELLLGICVAVWSHTSFHTNLFTMPICLILCSINHSVCGCGRVPSSLAFEQRAVIWECERCANIVEDVKNFLAVHMDWVQGWVRWPYVGLLCIQSLPRSPRFVFMQGCPSLFHTCMPGTWQNSCRKKHALSLIFLWHVFLHRQAGGSAPAKVSFIYKNSS